MFEIPSRPKRSCVLVSTPLRSVTLLKRENELLFIFFLGEVREVRLGGLIFRLSGLDIRCILFETVDTQRRRLEIEAVE